MGKSMDNYISSSHVIKTAINTINLRMYNLDELLYRKDHLLIEDLAQGLYIDIREEDEKTYYAVTIEEKIKHIMDDSDSILCYDPWIDNFYCAPEGHLKQAIQDLKDAIEKKTHKDIRLDDRSDLVSHFNSLLDIYDENGFLTYGQVAFALDLGVPTHQYEYYCGSKGLYREWLCKRIDSYDTEMAESDSIMDIANLSFKKNNLQMILHDFDKEIKNGLQG